MNSKVFFLKVVTLNLLFLICQFKGLSQIIEKRSIKEILSKTNEYDEYMIKIDILKNGKRTPEVFWNSILYEFYKQKGFSKKAYIKYVSKIIMQKQYLESFPDIGTWNIDTSRAGFYLKKIHNEIDTNPNCLTTFFGDNNVLKSDYTFLFWVIVLRLWDKGVYIKTCNQDVSTYCVGKVERKASQIFKEYGRKFGVIK